MPPSSTDPAASEPLLRLWLHGRPPRTQVAYTAILARFHRSYPGPLADLSLADLQTWADSLAQAGLATATRAQYLGALKSLLSFGHRLGYLSTNPALALRLPRVRPRLAERLLTEADVRHLIAAASSERNRTLLLLLYATGLRVSELCSLRWQHLVARDTAGQLTLVGKGDKERHILLPPAVWAALLALRQQAPPEAPVFRSRKGGRPLQRQQVHRLVRTAARRAGLSAPVSPHWLRHAHASHALQHGAAVSLVAATLGHSSIATTSRYLHARPDDSSSLYLPLAPATPA